MKAFTLYPKEQRELMILLDSLRKYGQCNCDVDTFAKIYKEWHLEMFPGCPVNLTAVNFRGDWLSSFVNYISNYEIGGK